MVPAALSSFRLHSLVALVLVAFWLPATLHCGLEAAGIWTQAGCCPPEESGASDCATDNCSMIEGGAYFLARGLLNAPAPVLAALAGLCRLTEIAPESIVVLSVSPDRSGAPPELVRTWQFAARAALPPRAPSTLKA
ncbi:MAG: hypothetical protein A3G75_01020 [Verrucomicrobia bacterium RIFCSPLOWO2_12_FULL_64_8]|nr:MAG: hypothetical protein A3G75_01020 [Verrucomicrobia bacterium RIFCSPLOWO2_12_FULL_64_8]